MMKKLLASAAMLIAAITMNAEDAFTIGWNHTLDSKPKSGDSPSGVEIAKDGDYLVFHTWGSTGGKDGAAKDENAQLKIDNVVVNGLDGTPIYGAGYWSGNSYNANIALSKVDKSNGNVLWTVYSDRGDNLHSYCHMQPSSDGGAYLLLYSRHWDEDTETTLLRLRSTKSNESVTINTTLGLFTGSDGNEHKYYVPVLAKVSANGAVEWAKVIIEPTPVDKSSKFPAWISMTNSFAVDENDNIYVGGNYRTTLTFTDKNGNKTTTTAFNGTESWDGDDQGTLGDLFVAKFNSEGDFQKLFTVGGDNSYANAAFADQLTAAKGKVFFEGRLVGNGSTVTIAGTDMTASTVGQSMIYGAFDEDLTPLYAKLLNQTGTTGALQCENIQYLNGAVYMTGSSMKQTYSDGDKVVLEPNATGKALHQGFVIKVNPENGAIIAAGNQGNSRSISKYYGVFETRDSEEATSLYALGYEMTGGSIIATLAIDETNATITKTGYKDLVLYGTATNKSGTIAVCGTPAIANGEVIFIHRFGTNGADKNAYFYDGTASAQVHSWANIVFSIKNENIYVESESTTPTGINDIKTKTETENNVIYNLQGMRLNKMQRGINIVNGKKIFVK